MIFLRFFLIPQSIRYFLGLSICLFLCFFFFKNFYVIFFSPSNKSINVKIKKKSDNKIEKKLLIFGDNHDDMLWLHMSLSSSSFYFRKFLFFFFVSSTNFSNWIHANCTLFVCRIRSDAFWRFSRIIFSLNNNFF